MPEVICILWRPDAFKPAPFVVRYSEFKRPIDVVGWSNNALVVTNYEEVMAEIKYICRDIVVDIKVQNDKFLQLRMKNARKKQKTAPLDTESDSHTDTSSEKEDETSSSNEVSSNDESSTEEESDDE